MKRNFEQDSYLEKNKVARKPKRAKSSKFDNKRKRRKFDDHNWQDD